MQLSRSRVTDGEWHHLLIELKSAKEGKDIKYLAVMTLDYGRDQVSGLCTLFGTDPSLGPAGSQGDPARCQVLVDLEKCFLGSPELGSDVPPAVGSREPAPHPCLDGQLLAPGTGLSPAVCPSVAASGGCNSGFL